jgi:hypothetical protein
MTSEGGSYYAYGVGSALMGRGAHIFLIDDPFGSMAEARSEIGRKAVHSWYQGTVYNRLEKGAAIVIMVAVMAAAMMLMRRPAPMTFQ